MKRFLVLFEKSKTGYGAYVPDLPGVGVTGETMDEAERLIYEAIEFHLEGMAAAGETIPEPSTTAEIMGIRTDELLHA
jgi:predicted RNase H-like HicB family nuclease